MISGPEKLDMALKAATSTLTGTTETPRLDAEYLMAHALGMTRGEMLLKRRDLSVPAGFAALIERREAGEPVAYICGVQEFWDLTLKVTPDVLIPRADSETLIEATQSHFAGRVTAYKNPRSWHWFRGAIARRPVAVSRCERCWHRCKRSSFGGGQGQCLCLRLWTAVCFSARKLARSWLGARFGPI